MKRKKIEYSPEKTEDFCSAITNGRQVPSNYLFVHKNPIFRFFTFITYYFLATPILWSFGKIVHHTKVVNKRYIHKQLKDTGYFIYSNHTLVDDGFNPAVFIASPKRTYIISLAETLMVNKPLQIFLTMLGAYPLPSDFRSAKNFLKGIEYRLSQKAAIAIYPEGTIWPYYTGQRPIKNGSFKYPRTFQKPIVFACTTYRKPKGLFKKLKKPRIVIYLSDPVFPSRNPIEKNDEERLESLYKAFVENISSLPENYAAYDYLPKKLHKNYLDEHLEEAINDYMETNDALKNTNLKKESNYDKPDLK